MKKWTSLLLANLLALSLAACGGQPSSDVPADSGGQLAEGFQLESSGSDTYTDEEIQAAADVITQHFQANFPGCTMTSLSYEDALSAYSAPEWAAQYGADQAIVFQSSFTVEDPGQDSTLNPNSTYPNWQWILVRPTGAAGPLGPMGKDNRAF